jgi:hypothetical protein
VNAFGASSSSSVRDPNAGDLAGLPRLHGIPSVIWGTNEDSRLLLRGLLHLHHCTVLHEVGSCAELDEIPSLTTPTVLIVDSDGQDDDWLADLAAVVERRPEFRAVVILPKPVEAPTETAKPVGASVVLHRPFTIPDFVRAVAAAADADPVGPGRSDAT